MKKKNIKNNVVVLLNNLAVSKKRGVMRFM